VLESITIENYKSIEKVTLPLGRINVFIGENGAGKSNILEAIALAGAAQARKLDNEFLTARGIRVTGPKLMRSAFKAKSTSGAIKVSVQIAAAGEIRYELSNDNRPYSSWKVSTDHSPRGDMVPIGEWFKEVFASFKTNAEREQFRSRMLASLAEAEKGSKEAVYKIRIPDGLGFPRIKTGNLEDFIIYAPENSALRTFEREGQIEPLGINGEGLLKLLRVTSRARNKASIKQIKESLKLFSWFKDFRVLRGASDDRVEIIDRFLHATNRGFDQRSANEGFLFLAFYLTLFTSQLTPRFFAIDNVDSSLNPKLCAALMRRLAMLAKEHEKQVLFTTHNPALLDGLDLGDPEHRLFIVSRGPRGQTRVRAFERKPSSQNPRRLSELFLSGVLGGLPKGF